MKEPVNLNKFRKNKIRLKKAENGNANAVKFGQTKTEQQKNILNLKKKTLKQIVNVKKGI
jgi:hypothetical protein